MTVSSLKFTGRIYLSADEARLACAQIVAVYRAVFSLPPYNEDERDVDGFARSFSVHCEQDGFRCCVAQQSTDEVIVGFVYGFTGRPGDGWWDSVAEALSEDQVGKRLSNCFALAELAVIPAKQGQGIGGRLHDALLEGLPHRTAILSTIQAETAAMGLYRKRGWATLLSDFLLPGMACPYVVMGLELTGAENESVRQ